MMDKVPVRLMPIRDHGIFINFQDRTCVFELSVFADDRLNLSLIF